MTQHLMEPPMAKKARKDVPVRIDEEVIRLARIVAAYRGEHLSEYLSELLRPIVKAELAKHQRQSKAGKEDA